ncbi:MAG: MerR family transcriptional regulator [Chloroflexi bacterium]|nr:MerR family transcriptional regulator [Chloroflexota bacterium]
MQKRQHIGELARTVQLSPKTIRYYEEIGLLPRAQRNGVGYRLYSPSDVERLSFIRRARLLGLPLRDIKGLVGYATCGECGHLRQHLLGLLRAKRAEIARQVDELRSLKADLERLEVESGAGLDSQEWREGADISCSCLDFFAGSGEARPNEID